MIRFIPFVLLLAFCISCINTEKKADQTKLPLEGTWQLISATSERNDSVVRTDPPGTRMIKIINADHFAFLNHDVKNSGDSTKTSTLFVAGGGHYTLVENKYTEYLEYCSARDYEGHTFEFTVEIKGDTLIQSGVEKLKDMGIGEANVQLTETYLRVRK